MVVNISQNSHVLLVLDAKWSFVEEVILHFELHDLLMKYVPEKSEKITETLMLPF